MVKHGGCFVCGSKQDEVLISIPDLSAMESVALCRACHALPQVELRKKIERIREAIRKAREAAATTGE
jgi:hypothetical protein